MGAQASPRSHRRRRMMSEINVVPYIDVMLVLLIIFMVTAVAAIKVTIRQDGSITVRKTIEGQNERPVARDELASSVKALSPALDAPVIIAAEKAVRYEHVIGAMNVLQRAGLTRVGLDVGLE